MRIKNGVLQIFNGAKDEYGGHWQIISSWTGLDYFYLGWSRSWKFQFCYNHDYFDGQIHTLIVGFLFIYWGGKPFIDMVDFPKNETEAEQKIAKLSYHLLITNWYDFIKRITLIIQIQDIKNEFNLD